MALFQYIQQLNSAINGFNGAQLGQMFKKDALTSFYFRGDVKLNTHKKVEAALEKEKLNLDEYCKGQVPSPYDEMMAFHFKGILAIAHKNYPEAYNHQANLVQFAIQFQNEQGNWTLPVLSSINLDLRVLARMADEELKRSKHKQDKLEDAARILNSCFAICIRDGAVLDQSKKWGTLSIINNLFKIYFTLNNLRLCKNLIRPVESPGFPPINQFNVAQLVTYKFYVGRLAMFDGQFNKAEQELSFAFQHCTVKNQKNKRKILLYLTPVKILLGKMPSAALLKKYNFPQFADLVSAVQTGNLKLFNDTIAAYQEFYIRKGVLLILEKSKILAYRNLFKKVYLLQKTTKLRLAAFVRAFQWMGIPADTEEVECILANLIYAGYIKGYIAHQHGILVVSQKEAFPPVKKVLE